MEVSGWCSKREKEISVDVDRDVEYLNLYEESNDAAIQSVSLETIFHGYRAGLDDDIDDASQTTEGVHPRRPVEHDGHGQNQHARTYQNVP